MERRMALWLRIWMLKILSQFPALSQTSCVASNKPLMLLCFSSLSVRQWFYQQERPEVDWTQFFFPFFFFFSSSQICSVLTALIFFGFILIVLWRRCLIELQKNNGTSFRGIFIEFLRKADNPKVLWIIELVPCAEHPWKSWTSRFLEVCASLPSDCTD